MFNHGVHHFFKFFNLVHNFFRGYQVGNFFGPRGNIYKKNIMHRASFKKMMHGALYFFYKYRVREMNKKS